MGQFAASIGQLPRIVTLNDVSLTVSKEGVLVMDAVAKTFRNLDEEELAETRRAIAASKKVSK
jgi:type IV pilus assembly protein PilO